jgi:uracil-DNA glycosylase
VWSKFGVNADDALRKYLEQRLELGETTIVLESTTAAEIADALRNPPRAGGNAPSKGTPDRATTHPSGAVMEMPDWRAALKEQGVEPSPKPDRPHGGIHASPSPEPANASAPPTAAASGGMATLDSLNAIAASVSHCTKCPLYATATNPVPGEGNPDADFMVVGEAPGATEDETGRPFVGRAGQLLTQILAAIGLSREDVFICNVLKHRPPGNRNPEPAEVIACSPYLIRQIELIKPKVILALGTFSAQTLLDTKISIGKLRGQIHQYHGVPVVVTYHPAALLRNPAWKRPTWEDVQLARRILDSAVPGA